MPELKRILSGYPIAELKREVWIEQRRRSMVLAESIKTSGQRGEPVNLKKLASGGSHDQST